MLSEKYKADKIKLPEPNFIGVLHDHSAGYYRESCGGCQYENRETLNKPKQKGKKNERIY